MPAFTPLALASEGAAEAIAALTREAVDAWRTRWALQSLHVAVQSWPWDGAELADAQAWKAREGATGALVRWPSSLEEVLMAALFGAEHGRAAHAEPRIAASACHHLAAELRSALALAWHAGEPDAADDASASGKLSRWCAPVELQIRFASEATLVAVVRTSHLKRTPGQPLPKLPRCDAAAFQRIPVRARLVVGQADIGIPDIASLQVGDVVVLDTHIHDPVHLVVDGSSATLRAHLGQRGQHRAAQVLSSPRSS